MNKIVRRSRRRFKRKVEKAFRSLATSMGLPYKVLDVPRKSSAFLSASYKSSLGTFSLCFTCGATECPLRGNRFGIRRCDDHLVTERTFIDPETKKAMRAIYTAYLR